MITEAFLTLNFTSGWMADSSYSWASGGAKLPRMGDSLHRTPLNYCTKFDATCFFCAGEIRNYTSKQTKKQTVNDIYTLCLLACVD